MVIIVIDVKCRKINIMKSRAYNPTLYQISNGSIMWMIVMDIDHNDWCIYFHHWICSSYNHSHYGSFETGHRHGGWSIYFQHCDLFQLQSFIMDHLKLDIDTVVDLFIFNTGSVPVTIIHIMWSFETGHRSRWLIYLFSTLWSVPVTIIHIMDDL